MKKLSLALLLLLPLVSQASELRVLSWNLFMLPKPVNFTLQQKRTKIIAKTLPAGDHDVYMFQETFSGASKRKLKRAFSKSHPYQARLNSDYRKLRLLDSGLMIFSRYPMKVLGKDIYDQCIKADCFSAKGVILVEVTMPDQKKVQLATTHLQAWDTAKAVSIRRSQLTQVKELFKKHEQPDVAQLLIGDINIDGLLHDEYTSTLDFLGMDSAPLDGAISSTNGFKSECYKTPGGEHAGQWLDHVWIKPHQSTTVVEERKALDFYAVLKKNKLCPLSDHRAVEATIKL